MSATIQATTGHPRLEGPGHVCWTVDDDHAYVDRAGGFLGDGQDVGEKPLVFGPSASRSLEQLKPRALLAADPYVDFLDRGALDPERMFTAFREQSSLARREGYRGLRVVADMDWLLPAGPSPEAIIGFELLLDRLISELGATVVCAYRRRSFAQATIAGVACVHPVRLDHDEEPPFRFVAGHDRGWRVSGEVDTATASEFSAALAALPDPHCVIDVSGLDFIDLRGMRAIAELAHSRGLSIQLHRAPPSFERYWRLAGLDTYAPTVIVSESSSVS